MGRLTALAAAAVIAVLPATASAGADSGSSPKLAVVDRSPLVVAGRSFQARELVRFRVLGTAWRFDVNADAKGRFVVRLVDVLPGVCGVRALRGTGTSGSRTILKGLRLGVCAPGKPALDGCAGPVTFPSGPCVPPPRR